MNQAVVDQAIANRQTRKILADEPTYQSIPDQVIDDLVHAAAHAPFHYPATTAHRQRLADDAPEPWRFYILSHETCLALRQHLLDNDDMSKVPNMLAAAGTLIQATWCPNAPPDDFELSAEKRFYPSDTNMEHIAATAAAIQNLLVAATARNISSYWSSGGPLRHQPVFELLGIPSDEILLGSIFLSDMNPADAADQLQVIPGKMREKKSSTRSWCRHIEQLG